LPENAPRLWSDALRQWTKSVWSHWSLRQIGVNRNCSAYIAESGAKFGISQTSMHSSKNVAEYVIVKIVMHVMQPKLCVMMSFCRLFYFEYSKLANYS
jgi:hypothetical protein